MKFDHALVYDISGLFSPLSFFALGYFIRRFVSETIRELIFRSCVTPIIYHDNIAPDYDYKNEIHYFKAWKKTPKP